MNKTYYSPTRPTTKNKQVYILHIGDRETLLALLPRLFPHLGKRRQARVQVCLDALRDWEKWLADGGRSKMAKIGFGYTYPYRNQKLVVSKSSSEDMVLPEIS